MVDVDFFKRPSKEVAEDLVAMVVSEHVSGRRVLFHGWYTEIDAFDKPEGGRSTELFTQEPGKIGYFISSRGSIPLITAHIEEEGGSGLVTLRKLAKGEDESSTLEVNRILDFETKSGLYVGKNSKLYINERPFDLKEQRLEVKETHPADGSPNLIARYSLRTL